MAQSEVLREFLVKLSVVKDEPAFKKFEDSIGRITVGVLKLGAAVTAMATTVSIGVERFAARLEGLYFAAQRVGTTVQNLTAFQRAAQNFGVSAEEAGGSLESLAQAMLNPALKAGLSSLLERGGFKFDKDSVTNLINLGKVLSTLQPIIAQRYLQMFNLPTDLGFLNMLRNPQLMGEFAKMQRLTVGSDKTAADAHRFMESFRTFSAEVMKFGLQIYDVLEKKLGLSLDKLTAWLDKNGQRIATELVAGIKELWDWITNKLIPTLEDWYKKWDKLNTEFDGWPNKIAGVLAALKLLGGTDVLGGMFNLTAQVLKLGAALLGVEAGATAAMAPVAAVATLAAGTILVWKKAQENKQDHGSIFSKDFLEDMNSLKQFGESVWQSIQPSKDTIAAFGQTEGTLSANGRPEGTLGWLGRLPALGAQSAPGLAALNSSPTRPPLLLAPSSADTAASVGASPTISIVNNNNFNIDGAKSPEATARAVERSFQNMTRNTLQTAGGR